MDTKKIDWDELKEIEMDLHGVVALLTLLECSEYYKGQEEVYVCRALKNNVIQIEKKIKALF